MDLADGALAKAYKDHQQQIDHIDLLGQAAGHTSQLDITRDLTVVEQEVIQNVTFLSSSKSDLTSEPSSVILCSVGLKKASDEYSMKQHEEKAAEKVMFKLAWDVQEL